MSIQGLRKFNHHPSGMIEGYLGDYYYDTEVDEYIRTQKDRIASLESQLADALAVIAKKDKALIKACELIEKFSLQVYNGSDCLMVYDAVELQPADVDLVESGYLDEFDNFEKSLKPWMQEEPNVNWQPVYTIKTKE